MIFYGGWKTLRGFGPCPWVGGVLISGLTSFLALICIKIEEQFFLSVSRCILSAISCDVLSEPQNIAPFNKS